MRGVETVHSVMLSVAMISLEISVKESNLLSFVDRAKYAQQDIKVLLYLKFINMLNCEKH